MKCKTVIIENDREEEVIIYAHEGSTLGQSIENLIKESEFELIGYRDKTMIKLMPEEVYAFTVENNKVVAVLEKGKYEIRKRLYELSENLKEAFVKINQSTLINLSKTERFDASLSGALLIVLKNGFRDYVSRRELKNVKERLGIKK